MSVFEWMILVYLLFGVVHTIWLLDESRSLMDWFIAALAMFIWPVYVVVLVILEIQKKESGGENQ